MPPTVIGCAAKLTTAASGAPSARSMRITVERVVDGPLVPTRLPLRPGACVDGGADRAPARAAATRRRRRRRAGRASSVGVAPRSRRRRAGRRRSSRATRLGALWLWLACTETALGRDPGQRLRRARARVAARSRADEDEVGGDDRRRALAVGERRAPARRAAPSRPARAPCARPSSRPAAPSGGVMSTRATPAGEAQCELRRVDLAADHGDVVALVGRRDRADDADDAGGRARDDRAARGRAARGSGSGRRAGPASTRSPRSTNVSQRPRLRREQVVLDLGRPHDHRRLEAERSRVCDLAREHAEVAQHVREAALRDPVRRGGDVAAAAELGRDDDLALPLGLADEQAGAGDVDVDEVEVGVPGEHRRRPSARRCSASSTQCISDHGGQRPLRPPLCMSTTMSARGKRKRREEVGELLVGRPVGRARERAVEVRARRPEARVGARGVGRGARDDDQPARARRSGCGLAREAERGDLPLRLVAVDAAEDDRRRARRRRGSRRSGRRGATSRSCCSSAAARAGRPACPGASRSIEQWTGESRARGLAIVDNLRYSRQSASARTAGSTREDHRRRGHHPAPARAGRRDRRRQPGRSRHPRPHRRGHHRHRRGRLGARGRAARSSTRPARTRSRTACTTCSSARTRRDVERLWQKMYRGLIYIGRRGIALHALSGIDIALWDIKGKAEGKPVCELLGDAAARQGARLRVDADAGHARRRCASASPRCASRASPPSSSAGGRSARTPTHDVELAPPRRRRPAASGDDPDRRRPRLRRRREDGDRRRARARASSASSGSRSRSSPTSTRRTPSSRTRSTSASPPASRTRRCWGFRELIERGHVDLVQPDVTRCGGITELLRIAELAREHGVETVPHAWKSGIIKAASLHVQRRAARRALPGVLRRRHADQHRRSTKERLPIDADGFVAVPTGPGLGVELDEDVARALPRRLERRPTWQSTPKSDLAARAAARHPGRRQQRPAPRARPRGARRSPRRAARRSPTATGNTYTDYHAAFGPPLLGHNDPDVDAAVAATARTVGLMGIGVTRGRGRARRADRRRSCRRSSRCCSPRPAARRPSTRCASRARRPAAAT